MLEFPPHAPVYPTERDIEEHVEGYRMIFRRAPSQAEIDEYARKPMGWLPRGAAYRVLQIDAAGRAWVRSTRQSERGSFLEVFQSGHHLGAIGIMGRVVAFEIADSFLVALVESLEQTENGLYPRRLEWYRIVDTNGAAKGSGE